MPCWWQNSTLQNLVPNPDISITSSPITCPETLKLSYLMWIWRHYWQRNEQMQEYIENNFPNVTVYGLIQEDIVPSNVKSFRRYGEYCSVLCKIYLKNSFSIILMPWVLVAPVTPWCLYVVSTDTRIRECVGFGFLCCFEEATNHINFTSETAVKIWYCEFWIYI
jgi:hypothetical protein